MTSPMARWLLWALLLTHAAASEAYAQSTPEPMDGSSSVLGGQNGEQVFACDLAALARLLEAEPDVQELITAASSGREPPGYEAERRRLRRAHVMPTRARLTGGLRVDRESESRRRVVQGFDGVDADDASIEDRSTDDRDLFVDLGVSLEWRLDQLVRDDREVEVMRQSARERDAEVARRRELIELFYERRQLLAEFCLAADGEQAASLRATPLYLSIEQLEAELAVITLLAIDSEIRTIGDVVRELTQPARTSGEVTSPRVDSDRPEQ